MMKSADLKPMRFSTAITAILVVLFSTSIYILFVRKLPGQSLETATVASNFHRLEKEVDVSGNRRDSIELPVLGDPYENKLQIQGITNNALAFMDPEGIESILSEYSNSKFRSDLRSNDFEKLRITASDLFSERARKRRFESHQIMQKIAEIESRLNSDATDSDLKVQKDYLGKTRAILLTEYPKDTLKAIELNPNNARAIYDLCRFMQDKIGSYDRQVVIRNFERIIELRWGKTEKDGDFLNANINLTVLNYEVGNEAKARCYSAQTIEKHLARSRDDYDYMFGFQPDGRINEPEFRIVTNKVNPTWALNHPNCLQVQRQ